MCVNHLNIIDSIIHFTAAHRQEQSGSVDFAEEKEREAEKEKSNEKEKYQDKYFINSTIQFRVSTRDQLTWFHTKLNPHPFTEDDIRPPRLA